MATAQHGLSDFLIRLGDDPELFAKYVRNPEAALKGERLTRAERDAILSGDLLEIRAAIGGNDADPEKPPTIMDPEKPPTIMEPEEPPTIMEPEEPPTIMEPEEPPTIMEPEEPPTIMEPEEPPTIMEPEEPQPRQAE